MAPESGCSSDEFVDTDRSGEPPRSRPHPSQQPHWVVSNDEGPAASSPTSRAQELLVVAGTKPDTVDGNGLRGMARRPTARVGECLG